MISQYDEASNHNGGDLHFGPDGHLYVALGDEGGGNDIFGNSQRIDRDFFAGLLRIDVDGRPGSLAPNPHPAVHAGAYTVPADNPFVGATSFNGSAVNSAAVRTEFWAVGLRNPWRFSFDPPTGRIFLGDVGQSAREEIDLVVRGGNYGWSYREGTIAGPRSNPPAGATFIDPIWDADRSLATSITGGVVYRGSRFAQLFGRYVFGDYGQNRVFALTLPASGPAEVQQIATESTPVGFGVDPSNGDVLIASIGAGRIRRVVYDSATTDIPLPTTLSATGVFADLATLTPAAGIVAYEPNVSSWSDHAGQRHWFSVPAVADKIAFAAETRSAVPRPAARFPRWRAWAASAGSRMDRAAGPCSTIPAALRWTVLGTSTSPTPEIPPSAGYRRLESSSRWPACRGSPDKRTAQVTTLGSTNRRRWLSVPPGMCTSPTPGTQPFAKSLPGLSSQQWLYRKGRQAEAGDRRVAARRVARPRAVAPARGEEGAAAPSEAGRLFCLCCGAFGAGAPKADER